MSFSVKASDTPTHHIRATPPLYPTRAGTSPTLGPSTPVPAPYVSPSLHSQSSRLPPPFSLGPPVAPDEFNASQNSDSQRGGSAQREPGAGRGGTDPTKYKTTICRNWEQTGACQFRGCTFAHGVDDLRPPARTNTSHVLNSVPGSTLQQLLTTQEPAAANSGPPPALAGTLRIEQIAELLVTEVNRQRDLVSVHVEANRTLENMLRREQQLRAESMARLQALEKEIEEAKRENAVKEVELSQLVAQADLSARKAMEAFASSYQSNGSVKRSPTSPPAKDEGAPYPSNSTLTKGSRRADAAATGNVGSPTVRSPTSTDDHLLSLLSSLNIGTTVPS